MVESGDGSLESALRRFAEEHALWEPGDRVAVGVSGGGDSTVLLRLLARCELELLGVHVHHGLRGEAADADARFAKTLCAELDLPFRLRRLDPDRLRDGGSEEARARRARYDALAACAREEGIGRIAVGHHRDDQVETLLLNLFRGTGLDGLAGMRPGRSLEHPRGASGGPDGYAGPEEVDGEETLRLIRPLLFAARARIEACAEAHGWTWRTDVSNRALDYRRNALRHRVLPRIVEQFGASALENAARASRLVAAYVDEDLRPRLAEDLGRWTRAGEEGVRLALEAWRTRPPVYRRRAVLELLARWFPGTVRSEAVAREIDALSGAQVGRRVELGGCTVWRERGRLLFAPEKRAAPDPSFRAVLEPGDSVCLPTGGRVGADPIEPLGESDAAQLAGGTAGPGDELGVGTGEPPAIGRSERVVEHVDAGLVEWPLTVRYWRSGDRIQPLGMEGSRAVADLLTDRKVPPHERDRVTLVCSGARTAWAVGVQLAHPVRIRASTRRVARLWADPEVAPALASSSSNSP